MSWGRWLVALLIALGLGLGSVQAEERRGQLANGLSYIIRECREPRQKAEFRLVLGIGSGVQEEGEEGVAHFLEHLAFAGGEAFPGDAVTRYVESLGTRYGIGLNAMTGHDRTVYMMSLPLDVPKVEETALRIMHDWLVGLKLDSAAVERERGIVKEEIRAYEQGDPFYTMKVGVGRHARSLPIGTLQDIDRLSPTRLRVFYRKWYTPELATLIVVGDVSAGETELLLRQIFGHIPGQSTPRPEETELSYAPGFTLTALTDTLLRTATLDLIFPHRTSPTRTKDELLQSLIEKMALHAWAHRTDQLRGSKLSDSWYLGRTSHLALTLEGKSTRTLLSDLRLALSALASLQRQGAIGQVELEELKSRAKSSLFALGEDTPATSWCDYYIDEILHGDTFLTSQAEVEALSTRIDAIQAKDLKAPLARLFHRIKGDALVAFSYNPKNASQRPPTKAELKAAIHRGVSSRRGLLRYVPRVKEEAPTTLSATPWVLTRGRSTKMHLASRSVYPELGVTEAFLPNGIRLILKPLLQGDSLVKVAVNHPFGLRSIPRDLQPKMASLAAYMELGGVEAISPKDSLTSYLYDHGVSMTLTEAMDWGAMMGTAPTKESYALLRLLREKMQRPERAYRDFEEIREGMLADLGKKSPLELMLQRQPERQLLRLIDSALGIFIPQREPETREEILALDLDEMTAFHQDLWSRTEGMTVLVVGRFDIEGMLHELSDTFADLPYRPRKNALPSAQSSGGSNTPRQVHPIPHDRYPRNLKTGIPVTSQEVSPIPSDTPSDTLLLPSLESIVTLEAEEETDKTVLHNIYYGSYEPGLRSTLQLKLIRELLRGRLIARLRSEAGIIYSPYIYLDYRPEPSPFVSFRMETTVQSENAPLACQLIEALVEELRTRPATEQELADIRRTFLINKREALTESNASGWQDLLLTLVRNEEQLEDFAHYDEILSSITPDELQSVICRILHPKRHLIYSVAPKARAEEKLKESRRD